MSQMRLIGKVKDAHGLKGELYVMVFADDVSWWPKLKHFGLGESIRIGQEAPANPNLSTMTCQLAKPFKKGLIIKPADVGDRTTAESLVGKGFWVPDEFFISKPGETIFLSEIEGFLVKDPEQKTLGQIVGFSSNGPQDLLVLKTATGQAEVPFVEAFLKKIDFEKKSVVMDLPEGLLELGHSPKDDGD